MTKINTSPYNPLRKIVGGAKSRRGGLEAQPSTVFRLKNN